MRRLTKLEAKKFQEEMMNEDGKTKLRRFMFDEMQNNLILMQVHSTKLSEKGWDELYLIHKKLERLVRIAHGTS